MFLDPLNLAHQQHRPFIQPELQPELGHGRQERETRDTESRAFGPESSQKILSQELLSRLSRALRTEYANAIPSLGPEDFAPHRVAGRIVSLVGGAVAEAQSNGADTNEIERILGRAGEAIDGGLAEIVDGLSQLGAMDARVAEDMARTRELTHQGLNSLHRREALRPVDRSEEGFAHIRASSYQEVTELSFAARTTDGDVISINITREQGETSERMAGADARSAIYLRTDSSYASESFSYQVEGNLDEEERQALASLLGRVDKVANQFFEGDLAAAFEKVNQLELGSDEIAAMSLDLSHRVARSEISAYQSVSGLGHDDSPPVVGAGRAAGHRGDGTLRLAQHVWPPRVQDFDSSNEFGSLLAGLDSILRDRDVERFFQDPRQLLTDLLNGRLSLDRRAEGLFLSRSVDRQ